MKDTFISCRPEKKAVKRCDGTGYVGLSYLKKEEENTKDFNIINLIRNHKDNGKFKVKNIDKNLKDLVDVIENEDREKDEFEIF